MVKFSVTGLPALAWVIGFIVLLAVPIWGAAHIVGAGRPAFARATAALTISAVMSIAAFFTVGGWSLLLAPVIFMFSFKYVLDTSFMGAFFLCLLSLAGLVAMQKALGGSMSFENEEASTHDIKGCVWLATNSQNLIHRQTES